MSLGPHARLRKWMRQTGTSQSELARNLGCTRAFTSALCRGGKALPGRLIANRIENITSGWRDGPIISEEWDAVEERTSKRKKAA